MSLWLQVACWDTRLGVASPLRRILARSVTARYTHGAAPLPRSPRITTLATPEDATEARSWVAWFKRQTIPRSAVKFTFSQSSGPGGQNVNKVNTKAGLTCPIDAWWIPGWAHTELRASPHYISSTDTIMITSSNHRSQAQNVDDSLSKLHALVLAAATAPIRNEPTEEQKKRVATLQRIEKTRRREQKSRHSEIKKSRATGKKGGWE